MDLTSEESLLNKQIIRVLKKVYQEEVTLEEPGDRKKILGTLLNSLKSAMLSDETFELLFKRYLFTGSAFEGLQVKEVNEFDIDIVLEFPPCFKNKYRVIEVENPAVFAQFQLTKSVLEIMKNSNISDVNQIEKLFDSHRYLSSEKVRSWCQSLVDKFLESSESRVQGIKDIKSTSSGPARTIEILLNDNKWISVDLVPVFSVKCQRFLKRIKHFEPVVPAKMLNECILVPKPTQNTPDEAHQLWRLHFPEAENSIMDNRLYFKPLIKLVKRLRDQQKWDLPSYFVKTVAFRMVRRHPEREYFSESSHGICFLQVLETLKEFLEKRHLGHIFYPEYNLLERMTKKNIDNLCNRIGKIIKSIKRDPNTLKPLYRITKYK